MSRQVETGVPVQDNFPALEDDGYSKRSGLLPADFTATVVKDGVEVALPVSIEEIGTSGEYKTEFTPTVDGFYSIQVLIDFNKDIWEGEYQAGAALSGIVLGQIKDQVDKIDLAPTRGLGTVESGSLMDRLCNKDAAKTYNQATDSMEAQRDRWG